MTKGLRKMKDMWRYKCKVRINDYIVLELFIDSIVLCECRD